MPERNVNAKPPTRPAPDESASRDSPEEMFRRGVEHYFMGEHAEELEWYRRAAERGHVIAQIKLGVMYDKGEDAPQDDAEAAKWYRRAAEQGDVEAQAALGWMHVKGRGVPQDGAEAVKWTRRAAERGSAQAQLNLGRMHAMGLGVPRDDAEAVKWYRRAAEQGHAIAQVNLGRMHAMGLGVPRGDAEAVKWYHRAAGQGYAQAQSNLGWMHEKGAGVPRDGAEAAKWTRRAAEQGHAVAQTNLGRMYENGLGVPQSDEEAMKWYRRAAGQGRAKAQAGVGRMFFKGAGFPQIVEGARVRGIVRSIADYGAFVEIAPGLNGLLHIKDLAWRKVADVEEVVRISDEVEVEVLTINRKKSRISLGMKQLTPSPWDDLPGAHPVGSRVFGTVVDIKQYGAFVDLGGGVYGLVHSSQMAWTRKGAAPARLETGQEVEVMILDIDLERRRVSLSVKQCAPNPWKKFEAAHRKGDRVKGAISAVEKRGLFVRLPGGEIDGMVRMSDLSYDEPAAEAVKKYEKGQEIETVLLGVEVERERATLGIKQLNDGALVDYVEANPKGAQVAGTVVQVVEKGAIVRLMPSVHGFVPAGEIAEERVEKVSDYLAIGDERRFTVLEADPTKRRIILSLKRKAAL